jgi:hypothetical protein
MCLSVLHDFLAQALDLLKLEPSMGKRDTGRWLVYGNSLPSLPEVGEPYAGKPHVRICAGGARGNSRPYREHHGSPCQSSA